MFTKHVLLRDEFEKKAVHLSAVISTLRIGTTHGQYVSAIDDFKDHLVTLRTSIVSAEVRLKWVEEKLESAISITGKNARAVAIAEEGVPLYAAADRTKFRDVTEIKTAVDVLYNSLLQWVTATESMTGVLSLRTKCVSPLLGRLSKLRKHIETGVAGGRYTALTVYTDLLPIREDLKRVATALYEIKETISELSMWCQSHRGDIFIDREIVHVAKVLINRLYKELFDSEKTFLVD
jgi:hypothetical protein